MQRRPLVSVVQSLFAVSTIILYTVYVFSRRGKKRSRSFRYLFHSLLSAFVHVNKLTKIHWGYQAYRIVPKAAHKTSLFIERWLVCQTFNFIYHLLHTNLFHISIIIIFVPYLFAFIYIYNKYVYDDSTLGSTRVVCYFGTWILYTQELIRWFQIGFVIVYLSKVQVIIERKKNIATTKWWMTLN